MKLDVFHFSCYKFNTKSRKLEVFEATIFRLISKSRKVVTRQLYKREKWKLALLNCTFRALFLLDLHREVSLTVVASKTSNFRIFVLNLQQEKWKLHA